MARERAAASCRPQGSRWLLAAAALAALVLAVLPQVFARAAAESGVINRYHADITVNADGSLSIDETVALDLTEAPSSTFTRTITTRERYDDDDDRVYSVEAVEGSSDQGPVTVSTEDDGSTESISVTFSTRQTGRVTLSMQYRVAGAVADVADGLELRWPVVQGFDQPVTDASVSWNAAGMLWLTCLTGEPGSGRPCTTAELVDVARPTMTELDIAPGEVMVGILGLGGASGISADADLQPRWSLGRAFTSSGQPLWLALAVLVLGVLAAFGLWWSRGRDQGAERTGESRPLTSRPDGSVVLSPPGGVRPGQMGTLVDEYVDAVDVSSTIIDLATRNYLFIEELPREGFAPPDWLLRRRNAAGDELIRYEREIFDALFAGSDEVQVSSLGPLLRGRLGSIQARMYDDMVEQGWFAERPDTVRGRWATAGWVLIAAGVALTVVLALASTFGLVGLAVILAGVALTGAGLAAPARTAKGSTVLGELGLFRAYLREANVQDIPAEQREELISRLYPYALVFGLGDLWAAALAETDTDLEPDEPIYWYGAPQDWHLSDAAPSLSQLAAALAAGVSTRQLLAPN